MVTDHVDGGAYITARNIFDNDIWRHPAQHRIFEYIRGRAIFIKEGYTIGGVHVPRGAFLASYRKLAEGTAWIERNSPKQYSISTVKEVTDALIAKGRLTKHETEICTLWHVTNYDKYQNFCSYENHETEQGFRTPSIHKIVNEINSRIGAGNEVPNGGSVQVPNNNKNVKRRISLLADKAEIFLKGKEIKFSAFVLKKRMQTWMIVFGEEALNEAFSIAADAWTSQGKAGDFLRYLETILHNDFPKLADSE